MSTNKEVNMESNFKAARLASGMSRAEAADIMHVSQPTVVNREQSPGSYRLGELRDLYGSLNGVGKRLLKESLIDYVCV